MGRPPRRPGHSVIDAWMLLRAWGILGGVSAACVVALFPLTLHLGGWHPGGQVALQLWRQATTSSFLAIVACQVGTAIAARIQTASLRQVGLGTNPLLLWAVVTVPFLRPVFDTAIPPLPVLIALVPLPTVVWGVDEVWRWRRRRSGARVS